MPVIRRHSLNDGQTMATFALQQVYKLIPRR